MVQLVPLEHRLRKGQRHGRLLSGFGLFCGLRRFPGFGLGGGRLGGGRWRRLGLLLKRFVHPLQDGHLRAIPPADAGELDDARVAAHAILKRRGDLIEQDANHVVLLAPLFAELLAGDSLGPGEKPALGRPQPCGGQAAMVQGAPFAEGHHLLGDDACRLGLGQGGGDFLLLDEAAHQVGEHRVSMLPGAAQLGGSYSVTHGLAGGGLFFVLDRWILEDFRRGCRGKRFEKGRVNLFAQ